MQAVRWTVAGPERGVAPHLVATVAREAEERTQLMTEVPGQLLTHFISLGGTRGAWPRRISGDDVRRLSADLGRVAWSSSRGWAR